MELVDSYPQMWTGMMWVIFLLILWTIPWKGVALWRAAGNKHLGWFIAIFLLNTLAILEIIYIFGFSRKKSTATA